MRFHIDFPGDGGYFTLSVRPAPGGTITEFELRLVTRTAHVRGWGEEQVGVETCTTVIHVTRAEVRGACEEKITTSRYHVYETSVGPLRISYVMDDSINIHSRSDPGLGRRRLLEDSQMWS